MSEKEEEFPFEDFVEALSEGADLRPSMKGILWAVTEKNIYWIYSAISTIYEILKSKEEDPTVKCRCLEALYLLICTCEYPVITLVEVYLLPILQDVAFFRNKKSQEALVFYFKQVCSVPDSPQTRKCSLEFVERATQLIFLCAILKPYRTVEVEQLKQQSNYGNVAGLLIEMGIKQPGQWKWCQEKFVKNGRKEYLDRLRKFEDESQGWAEFLLVNLLEEIKSGKKELLQLRQLIAYGECYLTSPVINVCEDEMTDLSENFQEKRRYIGLLNELVRCGDIEAIIMIKNSEFLPAICARIGTIPGHLGVLQGEQIFPEIQASKQIKKEFYCDFLRSLENWAKAMPSDYDSQDFNIVAIYKFLKEDRKFKFPDNLHVARFDKQAKVNLIKNKERNQKLIEIFEKTTTRQPSLSAPYSKSSHLVNAGPGLTAQHLQIKLDEAQKGLKNLMVDEPTAELALKMLTAFKDNWIGYLQALNLQQADEEHLQNVVSSGEKYVQQIQLIVPLGTAFTKGKFTYKEFKQRIAECLDFHHNVSRVSVNADPQKKISSFSRSLIKSRNSQVGKSQMGKSQFGKSKIAGRDLRDKIKEKSRLRNLNGMDMSKAMDRSSISKYTDRSRINRSKFTERSKYTNKSKLQNENELVEKSHLNQLRSSLPEQRSQVQQPSVKVEEKRENSLNKGKEGDIKDRSHLARSFRSQQAKENSKNHSKFDITDRIKQSKLKLSQAKPKEPSQMIQQAKIIQIDDYEGLVEKKKVPEDRVRRTNSKILLRRSNKGSRLQQSKESIHSRSSFNKQGKNSRSLRKSEHIQLNRTKKVSEIQSELKRNIEKVDETIELNGNIVKEGSLTQKKSQAKGKKQEEYDDFKDGHREISSIIHSNSVLKNFHNSAEKVFSTVKKQSGVKRSAHRLQESNAMQQEVGNLEAESHHAEEQEDSQDLIEKPDLLPMRYSYHKESRLKAQVKFGENPQFKEVFANRYEGLESREKDEKLLRTNSGLKNIIKSSKPKANYNKDSIMYQLNSIDHKIQSQKRLQSPALHEQYGGSFKSSKDLQIEAIQEKKNKEIALLRQKIRELQMETMSMRTKLIAKDNELKSMKNLSIAGSQRGFAHFTSPPQSNYDRTSHSRSEKGSIRGGSITKKAESSQFHKQVESGFKQYLQKIKGITFRKSLLKQKCLIHKSDEIEIGCLSQCGDTVLESTLYITPHRFDLLDFTLTIQHDSNMKIKATPEQVKTISVKKQQKIHITIEVLRLPFCLPELEINYKSASQYSSNYHRLTLPLAFNKFCEISSLRSEAQSQNHILYIRTDDFKLNSKVVKLDKLSDSFSSYLIVPPSKERSHWLILGRCRYTDSNFNICMNLSEKSSWIQGFLLSGDPKPMKFFICTNKEILDASKK